jgi:NAD(P)-dependent dehydrogenase (short-subunit alcohol dehydrogenase family)
MGIPFSVLAGCRDSAYTGQRKTGEGGAHMKLEGIEGKVAVVTGGGQGLGLGIALCLARDGADVAILDINGDTARSAAGAVAAAGRKSLPVQADLTDADQVKQGVESILAEFGRIDILVNNAGGYPQEVSLGEGSPRIAARTEIEWDGCYDINLKTTVLTCGEVVPLMTERKDGKIVNISSASASTPSASLVCYATMKAGIVHYTRMLARELAPDNINVNCVCPGIIYTPLWERGASEFSKRIPGVEMTPREFFERTLVPQVPLGREQTAEDIGNAVAFFVSDEARNITGQTLHVDGGMAFV